MGPLTIVELQVAIEVVLKLSNTFIEGLAKRAVPRFVPSRLATSTMVPTVCAPFTTFAPWHSNVPISSLVPPRGFLQTLSQRIVIPLLKCQNFSGLESNVLAIDSLISVSL